MPGTMTVTAKTGPGVQNTAVVIPNVNSFNVDTIANMLTGFSGSIPFQYSLTGVTTFTVVIAAGLFTITIS